MKNENSVIRDIVVSQGRTNGKSVTAVHFDLILKWKHEKDEIKKAKYLKLLNLLEEEYGII